MSITTDIARSYAAPRKVLRRRIAGPPREDRAFMLLLVGCLIMFVAQWPSLSRAAFEDPSIPLEARLGGALMAWFFIAPLLLYGLAALSHLVARLLGGQATFYGARMALFWGLLAASPAFLLSGLVAGFIGPGGALTLTSALAGVAFLWIWGAGLWEVEREGV